MLRLLTRNLWISFIAVNTTHCRIIGVNKQEVRWSALVWILRQHKPITTSRYEPLHTLAIRLWPSPFSIGLASAWPGSEHLISFAAGKLTGLPQEIGTRLHRTMGRCNQFGTSYHYGNRIKVLIFQADRLLNCHVVRHCRYKNHHTGRLWYLLVIVNRARTGT